jgi:hypothetical protein
MKLTTDDPKLTAYALGELPASERGAVEAALQQSPECRQAVEEIRGMSALLDRELAAEPCLQLQTAQQEAVLGALGRPAAAAREGSSWLSWLRWNPTLTLAGAAAAVLILVVVRPSNWRTSSQPATPTKGDETEPSTPIAVAPPAVSPSVFPTNAVVSTPEPVPPPPPIDHPRQPAVSPGASTSVVRIETPPLVPPSPLGERSVPLAMAPLPIKLPMPSFKGTPDDLPKGPNIEPFSDKPRPDFLAPAGVVNIALNKKVTSSDKSPITGSTAQITDGNKDAIDDAVVEMHKNVQWVQVDLEQDHHIYAILIWHDHRYVQVFRCVVVQVADDPDFTKNVQNLFNNDIENVAGLGIGQDKQYFETNQGKLIDTKGVKGRYLRFYSKGSNASALNCYTELEVYGLPAR